MARFTLYDYQEAPKYLKNADLSQTILILDESHNLVKYLRSADHVESFEYSQLYANFRHAHKILCLTGTPFFTSSSDIAYLLNLVSGKDLLPFVALGIVVLPVINAFTPLSRFPLRELNGEKLYGIFSEYVSHYDLDGDLKAKFPEKIIHAEDVNYNHSQPDFFFRFAQQSLAPNELQRVLKDYGLSVQTELISIASSSLQQQIARVPFSGREIGNLAFFEEETRIESPKLVRILEKIEAEPGKIVIYSNFYQNGIIAFAEFLKRHNISDFAILEPRFSIEEQGKIIRDYNENKTRILLLHPDIIEGISLKETSQVYILEPIYSSSVMEQVIGRAVRLNSHINLPENKRKVDIFVWKSILGNFSLDAYHVRKENWAKYTPELNVWSQWGHGMIQIDPNAKTKMQSPDDFAYSHHLALDYSLSILKKELKKASIESRLTLKD